MSYLPVAILAYFLNAVSVTADKFLLKKFIPDPLIYVFYISLCSLVVLILIPFTGRPGPEVFSLASQSTLLWTLGAYFMFKALSRGQVTRVIPVIGTLTALFLLAHAFYSGAVSINQTWGAAFLISGLIFLTFTDWRGPLLAYELAFEVGASLLFALSYLLLRQAYLQADFLTVLAWSRVVLLPALAAALVIPGLRKKITSVKQTRINFRSKEGALFTLGQVSGGASQLLLTFSVSLATPALVNSLQGIQYVFLLVFGLFLVKKFPKIFPEKLSGPGIISKTAGIITVGFGLYILSFSKINLTQNYGVTYSPLYAAELGLNPRATFTGMLDDLKVKTVRLPVYWSEVEKFPMQFSFAGLDYYLNEARKRDVRVILVLGLKQPRWPECFAPAWVKESAGADQQERVLDLVEREVTHFKDFENIVAWQVENEPFFNYGDCAKIIKQTPDLIKKEVETVKALDLRPVLITDSGELSSWVEATSLADIFGHTLYREVWSPILGTKPYPLPPVFYSLKAELAKTITGKNPKIIISELQAEPWLSRRRHTSQAGPREEAGLFPVKKLAQNIEYASQTGSKDVYLWGVEWWYYMDKNGYPEYLQFAKQLFP